MAYAARPDVQQLIAQFPLTLSTKPTAEQADAIIVAIGNEINGYLAAHGVVTPVGTPSYFVDWLKAVQSWGAAAAILKSMFPNAIGPGENPAYAFWQSKYNLALKGIMDESMIPEELLTVNILEPHTYLTRNPDTELEIGYIADPFFRRDKIF